MIKSVVIFMARRAAQQALFLRFICQTWVGDTHILGMYMELSLNIDGYHLQSVKRLRIVVNKNEFLVKPNKHYFLVYFLANCIVRKLDHTI